MTDKIFIIIVNFIHLKLDLITMKILEVNKIRIHNEQKEINFLCLT